MLLACCCRCHVSLFCSFFTFSRSIDSVSKTRLPMVEEEQELVSLQKCLEGIESNDSDEQSASDDQVGPVRHWKLGSVRCIHECLCSVAIEGFLMVCQCLSYRLSCSAFGGNGWSGLPWPRWPLDLSMALANAFINDWRAQQSMTSLVSTRCHQAGWPTHCSFGICIVERFQRGSFDLCQQVLVWILEVG